MSAWLLLPPAPAPLLASSRESEIIKKVACWVSLLSDKGKLFMGLNRNLLISLGNHH